MPQSKIVEGKLMSIRCAHGDTVLYPLAEVYMEVEGIPIFNQSYFMYLFQ